MQIKKNAISYNYSVFYFVLIFIYHMLVEWSSWARRDRALIFINTICNCHHQIKQFPKNALFIPTEYLSYRKQTPILNLTRIFFATNTQISIPTIYACEQKEEDALYNNMKCKKNALLYAKKKRKLGYHIIIKLLHFFSKFTFTWQDYVFFAII